MSNMRRIVGLDFGRLRDYSALTVLEVMQDKEDALTLRHLQRFALGTPYPRVADHVAALFRLPELAGATLVVDGTGVGQGVLDLFTGFTRPISLTITAGRNASSQGAGILHVPKRSLVMNLVGLVRQGRFQFAARLPHISLLLGELCAYRVKQARSGTEVFEAEKESDHDDLVMAVAMAAWVAANRSFPAEE